MVLLAALLSGCGTIYITPTPTDTPTPVLPTATVTPTVTLTETPRPTWTPVPTLTSTITSTATPLPTSTPVPDWCRASQRTPTLPTLQTTPLEMLRVAFISGGNGWFWEYGGEPEQVLSGGDIVSVDLSEDGSTLAFVRAGLGAEIWALDLESRTETLLVSHTALLAQAGQPEALAAMPHHLSWVPGRRALAYNARPVWPGPHDFVPDDLWTVEVLSGEMHNILPHAQGGEFVYSPDGRQIAVMDLDSLDLVDSAGGSRRPNLVPNYHGVGLGTDNYYPRPFWAADSRSLLVAVPTPLDAQKPNPEVTFYRLAPLFVRAKPVETVVAFPPSVIFSPDQSLAAYLRWPDLTPQIKELHLAIATGLESDDLLHSAGQNLEFLAWRPGSLDFAYWVPGPRRLMFGQLCAPPEPLVEEVFDLGAFRWVDSQHFLFASGSPEEAELFLGDLEGEVRSIGNLGDPVVFDFAKPIAF